MNPKVSIIVPVYNASDFLSQCVESLIAQTYQNIEIILVDDASQDDSPRICDNYAKCDSRIIAFHKQNEGASFARKTGIDLATGDYVMFVDGDDWIEPDTVSQLIHCAVHDDADCVLFSYIKEFKGHSEKVYLYDESCCMNSYDAEIHIHQCLIGPDDSRLSRPERFNILSPMWGKLYKANVVVKGLVVNEREIGGTGEDTLFNIYALDNCHKISYLHSCFYHYRKYSNKTLTTSYKPMLVEQLNVFYNYIETYINKRGCPEYRQLLDNRIACSIISLILNETNSIAGFFDKAKKIQSIMVQPRYVQAIRSINTKNCSVQWKLFFWLCQYQQALLVTGTVMAIKRLRHKQQ